jgi:hypothetical protein
MQRLRRLGCLTLMLVGLCSRPVEGGLKDWLEELSGPGPFHNDGLANLMFTLCLNKETPLVQAYDVRRPCIFVEYRQLVNDKDDNFYETIGEVRATIGDVGLNFRPWTRVPIDIGGGVGFIQFHTSQKSTTKATLVLPRVQIKPLEPLAQHFNNNRVARNFLNVLKFYTSHTVIFGTLQGEKDFGAIGSTFDVKNDGVLSYGFLLDFIELARP